MARRGWPSATTGSGRRRVGLAGQEQEPHHLRVSCVVQQRRPEASDQRPEGGFIQMDSLQGFARHGGQTDKVLSLRPLDEALQLGLQCEALDRIGGGRDGCLQPRALRNDALLVPLLHRGRRATFLVLQQAQ